MTLDSGFGMDASISFDMTMTDYVYPALYGGQLWRNFDSWRTDDGPSLEGKSHITSPDGITGWDHEPRSQQLNLKFSLFSVHLQS